MSSPSPALRASWALATRGAIDDATATAAVASLAAAGLRPALTARFLRDVESRVALPAAAAINSALAKTGLSLASDLAEAVTEAETSVAAAAARGAWIGDGGRGLRKCRAVLGAGVGGGKLGEVLCDVLGADFRAGEGDAGVRALCVRLVWLGFGEGVRGALGGVVFAEIGDEVRRAAEKGGEALPALRHWVEGRVVPWLGTVLEVGEGGEGALGQWRKRMSFHMHETLAMVRIEQILQLVANYPASLKALQDLKVCLGTTDKKMHLVRSLRAQFSEELLHAGSVTSEILQQYINMIKALRFLDPAGVILEKVSDPVRNCLRRRPDTVRCIVSGMTGDGDLFEELERGRLKSSQAGGLSVSSANLISSADVEEGTSEAGDNSDAESLDEDEFASWEPEPLDAPIRQGRWRSGGDAIATLVTIYGSCEAIVKEYQALLADKLVSNFDVDVEREARILELLQQRFGGEAMHDCSIMLKDMRDSRLSLATARSESASVALGLANFETTIVSKEFWPKLGDEPAFKPPSEMAASMKLFQESFERVKDPRKLRWMPGLGTTNLKITFEDGRRLSLFVSPFQAAIVLRFAHQSQWTVSELMEDLAVTDEAGLRRRLVLLANQDVIRATDSGASTYETIERAEDVNPSGGLADDELEEDEDEDMEGQERDEAAEMAVYVTFILAMLRNLKALPLDRIHDMLGRFCKAPAYDKTQSQLATFLAKLCDEEKIVLKAGSYSVKD